MTFKTEKIQRPKCHAFSTRFVYWELDAVPSNSKGKPRSQGKGRVGSSSTTQASLHLLSADAALLLSPAPQVQCLCIQRLTEFKNPSGDFC